MECPQNITWSPCLDLDLEFGAELEAVWQEEIGDHHNRVASTTRKRVTTKKSRHTPHALQPGHVVEKRNARERTRIQAVNQQFVELRKLLPLKRKKRIAKEKILHYAMTYMDELQRMITEHDERLAGNKMASCRFAQAQYTCAVPGSGPRALVQQNTQTHQNQENFVLHNQSTSAPMTYNEQPTSPVNCFQAIDNQCSALPSCAYDRSVNSSPELFPSSPVQRSDCSWGSRSSDTVQSDMRVQEQSSPSWFSIFGSSV